MLLLPESRETNQIKSAEFNCQNYMVTPITATPLPPMPLRQVISLASIR